MFVTSTYRPNLDELKPQVRRLAIWICSQMPNVARRFLDEDELEQFALIAIWMSQQAAEGSRFVDHQHVMAYARLVMVSQVIKKTKSGNKCQTLAVEVAARTCEPAEELIIAAERKFLDDAVGELQELVLRAMPVLERAIEMLGTHSGGVAATWLDGATYEETARIYDTSFGSVRGTIDHMREGFLLPFIFRLRTELNALHAVSGEAAARVELGPLKRLVLTQDKTSRRKKHAQRTSVAEYHLVGKVKPERQEAVAV